MTVYEDTRYKKCPPEETVDRIRQILESIHLQTEETWIDSGIKGLESVRVNISGTEIGQNGKGTTRAYARASGYAEFMERLQTGYLSPVLSVPAEYAMLSREETEKKGGKLLTDTLRAIRRTDGGFEFMPLDVQGYLKNWSYDAADGKLCTVPYVNQETGETEYIPKNILDAYYFTNGSCAGNSRQEAMVQGLSEIAERYACIQMMEKRLTPPVIPEETLREIPSLYAIIQDIRGREGLELRVMDASLGMGLPVTAVALIDRNQGKMVLRFGSHPRFETSLERCLTEIMQGKNIRRLDYIPTFDLRNEPQTGSIVNRFNFLKGAFGMFPAELFSDTPSWKCPDGMRNAPEDIPGQLEWMKQLYRKLGWTVYVRDCSVYGFPTYHLIVPGVSMVFDFGAERCWEKRNLFCLRPVIRGQERMTDAAMHECVQLMKVKKHFMIENAYSYLSGVPVTPTVLDLPLDAGLFEALCHLAAGEKAQASEILTAYCYYGDRRATKFFLVKQMLDLKEITPAMVKAFELIYPEGWYAEAAELLKNPLSFLPSLGCPDCSHCTQAGKCKIPMLRQSLGQNGNSLSVRTEDL